jgi:hypothetical protein
MNDIVAAHANTAIHVILDNLNTHKPRPLAQASSERAFPLHTDAGLLAQLGTVREVSPRFVSDAVRRQTASTKLARCSLPTARGGRG